MTGILAVELVRRHGGPVSHAALSPVYSTFRAPGIDGLVGFLPVGGCAVVAGDPICAAAQRAALAEAFARHCAQRSWSVLYAVATAPMRGVAHERGYGAMEFAELLLADPRGDPEAGGAGRRLRQTLNHVRREGVQVREYFGQTAPDAGLEQAAEAACGQWRASRQGPQMFLVIPRLFDDRPGRRWFVAEHEGRVVGVLSMLRIDCSGCRDLINIVFATPAAPRHTSELLVVAALAALRQEGAASVCYGIAPRARLGEIEGFARLPAGLARLLYSAAARLLHLPGKAAFWGKFGVVRREPLYLLFQPPRLGLRECRALLRAFNFSVA